MLTKTDLNQIGNVIDEKLEPIKKDLTILKSDVTELKKDVKYLKKKVNRIDKTVDVMGKLLDKEQMNQRKRLNKLEDHVGLNPL